MVDLLRRNWKGLVLLACLASMAAALTTGRPRPVSAAPPKDATYVGVKKCKTCHFKDYRRWKKMKHAGAWKTMEEKDKNRPNCYRCHVTGYGKPGGYVSEEKTPHLTGVQCESCHGPGSAHVEAGEKKEPKEKSHSLINKIPQNTCVECHDPHKTHEDYEEEGEAGKTDTETDSGEKK